MQNVLLPWNLIIFSNFAAWAYGTRASQNIICLLYRGKVITFVLLTNAIPYNIVLILSGILCTFLSNAYAEVSLGELYAYWWMGFLADSSSYLMITIPQPGCRGRHWWSLQDHIPSTVYFYGNHLSTILKPEQNEAQVYWKLQDKYRPMGARFGCVATNSDLLAKEGQTKQPTCGDSNMGQCTYLDKNAVKRINHLKMSNALEAVGLEWMNSNI